MMPNKLIVDLEDNPELRDAISEKSPGETCKLEVTAKLDEVTSTQAVLSVVSAEMEVESKPTPAEPTEFPEGKAEGPAILEATSFPGPSKK